MQKLPKAAFGKHVSGFKAKLMAPLFKLAPLFTLASVTTLRVAVQKLQLEVSAAASLIPVTVTMCGPAKCVPGTACPLVWAPGSPPPPRCFLPARLWSLSITTDLQTRLQTTRFEIHTAPLTLCTLFRESAS